jgi:hypothetical protein
LVITTLIKFTRDSIALQDANLRIKEIERENVESELRALKAQINPHFFFNLFGYNSPPLCGEWEKNPVIPRCLRRGASLP